MIYAVKIHSKKERFFLRLFIQCRNHEERTNVIHLMYDNGLIDLPARLIDIIKFNYLSKSK